MILILFKKSLSAEKENKSLIRDGPHNLCLYHWNAMKIWSNKNDKRNKRPILRMKN